MREETVINLYNIVIARNIIDDVWYHMLMAANQIANEFNQPTNPIEL